MNREGLEREIDIRTSRSSGAGGQHVNKTETRVELILDVLGSPSLTEREKKHLRHHLGRRLDARGVLSVTDQSSRSQHTNRKRALDRLFTLLKKGVRPIPKTHRGKAFVANKRKRLERKKRRGEVKAGRSKKFW